MYIYIPLYLGFFGLMSTYFHLSIEVLEISLSGKFCRSQAGNRATFLKPQSFKCLPSSLIIGCSPKKVAFLLDSPRVKLTRSLLELQEALHAVRNHIMWLKQ